MEKYDLIIIGGGSSGLMIADRLNDTKLKVLILEGSVKMQYIKNIKTTQRQVRYQAKSWAFLKELGL